MKFCLTTTKPSGLIDHLTTHPWDPNHPKKFRKNGGGVLIAHRNDLNFSSSKITITKAKAELLSVMFRLNNGKNLCISTFYRVVL